MNISIGGTLTSDAAPPMLMVAATWQWDSAFMFALFGWKAAIAVLVNATVATVATFALRKHLHAPVAEGAVPEAPVALAVVLVHLLLLAGVVLFAHHPVAFLGLFLMFLGFTQAYERRQSPLILKEVLLVAFFLAGLVVLGGCCLTQAWLRGRVDRSGRLSAGDAWPDCDGGRGVLAALMVATPDRSRYGNARQESRSRAAPGYMQPILRGDAIPLPRTTAAHFFERQERGVSERSPRARECRVLTGSRP